MSRLQRFVVTNCALAAILALCPLGGSRLAAQVAKGSISGAVVDPQGAVVPDATVRAVNKETNGEFKTQSDNAGAFRLSLLPVGPYDLDITHSGFRKTLLTNVIVSVGQDYDLGSIKLELGEVTATVEVTAAPPLLHATEAQISTAFQFSGVQTYPGLLENQGLDILALSVPGVVDNRDLGFSNTNGVGFAVNGIRGRNNDQQIDGQNNNDNSVAGPGLFISNLEFVQEYQITTSNFGPEYGRNSGSVVNIITKNGTNTWHGSIYGTESNSALDTLSNTDKAFVGLKKVPRYNDEFTGATIGGPWWKDKVFFFGGFDNEIISRTTVYQAGALTPTPAGLATLGGCYPSGISGNAITALRTFGPYGVAGGNPTPVGAPRLVNFSPGGGLADCPGVQFADVQRTLPNGFHGYDFIARLDIQTTKNHIYGRYIYNLGHSFNNNSFGTAAAGYPNDVPALSQDAGISWTRTLSSRMSNEVRISYGRLNVEFGKNSIGNTIPGQKNIGLAVGSVGFTGTIGGIPILGYGPATNAPQGRIVNTWQAQDNWNYVLGRHQLKAGVNFTYQRSPNLFLPNLNGAWTFGSFTTYIRNTATSGVSIALGDPSLDFREKDTFLYFGDDIKVTHNLTLNLGLTWTYYGQPANLFHDRTVARESSSSPLWNPALPLSVRTFPQIPAPKKSFGPSVGFAYSPQWGGFLTGNGKTVFRGGYRLAYDPPYYNIYLNISSASPVVFLDSITAAPFPPLLAAPLGPANRAELAPFLTPGVLDPRSQNETNLSPDFGPQRTHEWSFGVQREIRPNAVIETRYVGNHATRLFQTINGNPRFDGLAAAFPSLVPAGLTPCPLAQAVVPTARGRVNCNLGIVRTRTNTGYSDYNGWQTEFRGSNLWKQLTIRTAYTYSKTTDNVSEIFSTAAAGAGRAFAQNVFNFAGAEHGLSGLDFRHNWTIAFTEELPFFRAQNSVIGKILGGWVASATYHIASGQPYNPIQTFLNRFSYFNNSATSPFDLPFRTAFSREVARPYLGNPNAPVGSVGIFAGDACNIYGAGCGFPTTTLISLNAINIGLADTVVTSKDVRFIANTAIANQLFGTPFGNVGRNVLRDARTNRANATLFKVIKFGNDGRIQVRWHMSMLNVFNHPNFGSGPGSFGIDPFIEDAGDKTTQSFDSGFGDPSVFDGGHRSIRFGLRISF